VIKGAPETVLPLCGMTARMTEIEAGAARSWRLLDVAEAAWHGPLLEDPREYPFRWVGFVALADPLRPSVPAAVARCRRAGIRVMITGDFPGTAREIARQAGIDAVEVLTGSDVAGMSDGELAGTVKRVSVCVRVVPEQKLRLVAAYRTTDEVVAMTGDGVNDAPALKAAHIGIAPMIRLTSGIAVDDVDERRSETHAPLYSRRLNRGLSNSDSPGAFVRLDDVTRRRGRADQKFAPTVIDSHDAEGQYRDENPNMRLGEK
jgi:magnesium-transporting ATPase (P-type)